MDLRQTPEYVSFLKSIGWKTVKDPKSNCLVHIRNIPLTHTSVLKIQRPDKLLSLTALDKMVNKYRVIQSNIEVLNDDLLPGISKNRYKRNKIPFLPSTTIIIDLKYPKNILLSMMKSKTRYNIRLASKRGARVKIFNGSELIKKMDIFESLYRMQKQNAKRLGIFVLSKSWFLSQVKAFSNKCFAAMAYKDEELLAATFYMTSKDGLFYSHNGSTNEGRRRYAPSLCVWEGILEGKKRGLNYFDFEGIYDERSRVIKWQGFTKFKEGFGGRKIMYPGLYSKWHLPI